MKTDQFINMLSTNLEPADRGKMSRLLTAAVVLGLTIAIGAAWSILGFRPDYFAPDAVVFLCVKLLFAGSAAVLAGFYLIKSARPGSDRKIPFAVALPFAAIVLLAIASVSLAPGSHWKEMVSHDEWLECLISIPLIAIVPFAVFVWVVRQAAPTNLVRTGALIGVAAGSISAIGYALHCSADSWPFVAIWYGGTIALCALAGAALGPRLLRW